VDYFLEVPLHPGIKHPEQQRGAEVVNALVDMLSNDKNDKLKFLFSVFSLTGSPQTGTPTNKNNLSEDRQKNPPGRTGFMPGT